MTDYLSSILLILIGLGAIYAGKKIRKLSRQIKNYVSTFPETISIEIVEPKNFHKIRNPKVLKSVYTFRANNLLFEGKTTYDLEFIGSEAAMNAKYAEGEKEKVLAANIVWYDQNDPSISFLKKSKLGIFKLLPFLGYIFCFSGILWLIVRISQL